jgi:hypothetical protein
MRKLLLFIVALSLVSCIVPVPVVTEKPNVFIVNSAWKVVAEATVNTSRALDTTESLQAQVDAYNAVNTDDQYFLIDGEVPPIELSPQMNAYIVHYVTHEIIKEFLDWPRSSLETDRAAWALDTRACAGVLYIDRIPPPPEPLIDIRPDYEKFALYLVALNGTILYETHCEDFADAGYSSAELYYPERKRQFLLQAQADGQGEYVVAGRLYP